MKLLLRVLWLLLGLIYRLIVLVMFVVLGYRAVVSFREPAAASARQFL